MRLPLHRAKREEDGEEVIGCLFYFLPDNLYYISNVNCHADQAYAFTYEVDPKTIQESTGKNAGDTLLFEGDIIVIKEYPFYGDDDNKELNYVGVVCYDDEQLLWFLSLEKVSDRVRGGASGDNLSEYDLTQAEIVGNVFNQKDCDKYGLKMEEYQHE